MPKFGLAWAVAAAAIGSGFQHGYNTGVLNSPQMIMEEWAKKSLGNPSDFIVTLYWSTVVSIFCIGGMIGGAMTGVMSNKFGRKGSLLLNNILVVLAAICMVSSKYINSVYLLIAGRFIIGINCGLNAGLAPTYLNEISPVNQRGAIGSVYQLVITITILLAQVMTSPNVLGTRTLWPFVFGVIIFPAIFQMIALCCAPASPRYAYLKKNDSVKLFTLLSKMYYDDEILEKLHEIQEDIEDGRGEENMTGNEMLKKKSFRNQLSMVIMIMLIHKLTCINSSYLFGFDETILTKIFVVDYIFIIDLLGNLITTFTVDKLGRRILMLVSLGNMILTTIVMFISLYLAQIHKEFLYICVVSSYVFGFCYGLAVGPMPWIIGPEMFNTATRGQAVSICVSVNWFLKLCISIGFIPFQQALGPAVFLIFGSCQSMAFIFVWIFMPETAKLPVTKITAMFKDKS